MAITAVSVHRPIATTMAYLIVVVLGLVSFRFLPVDLLPPIEFPQLSINANYGRVGPEEMELIITERLENAVAGVPNVEQVFSFSGEGSSNINLRFAEGTNLDEAANDVRAALDRVRDSLPDEVEPPEIGKFDPNQQPIVVLGASSNRPLVELTTVLQEELMRRFQQIPGVGSIEVWGGVYREVNVDLLRDRLIASELTAGDVVAAINRENVNIPAGNVRDGLRDLYVRTLGEYTDVQQIADTVVTVVDGNPIRVEDVAEVELGYRDIGRYVEIAGLPTIRMGIRKQTGANTVEVARQIRAEMEKINETRSDLQMQVIQDQSTYIQSSIDNVRNSAIWGGILSVVVLFAFLRSGSATWVISISIPISIIATYALIYFSGLTLNQMTFGGIALGIGIIIDSSIVVIENIVRQRQRGKSPIESALEGTRQVSGAIIASTLTICIIFLPVMFMRTTTAVLFKELALVVVFSLLCSLVIALTFVPMLASRYLKVRPPPPPGRRDRLAEMDAWYARVIDRALHHRVAVVGVSAALFVASLLLVRFVPFELAPQADGEQIQVGMRMDDGTNIAVMYEYVQLLDAGVRAAVDQDDVIFMTKDVRNNRANVDLTLKPPHERSMTSAEIADHIREQVEHTIPGANIWVNAQSGIGILRQLFQRGGNEGTSLELQVRGYDLERAETLMKEMVRRIEKVEGVSDVEASNRERRPERNIVFDRERISQLGIGVQDIATAIQTSVGGRRAGVYRLDGNEVDINVRLRPEDRRSTIDLQNIAVRTAAGILPVSAMITQQEGRGPISINRIDGQRVSYISANLEEGVALGEAVGRIRDVLADMPMPDGFSLYFGGEYEEQQQAQRDFLLAILTAIVLIYMVMAAQFERFVDPLIVMAAVPVAAVGIVPTMLLTGTTFNLQSLMGVVMLVGIVVNNSIVLVDCINLLRREEGMGVREAVIEAGRLRLQPILMTTLTTILGLLPLSFAIGAGSELQAALARVVMGGLTASTIITLVLIPVIYVMVADFAARRAERRGLHGSIGAADPA
jgi:hydrophobic/amphiphilic exporter-1 (mainly G- bacteria), HAE1 family